MHDYTHNVCIACTAACQFLSGKNNFGKGCLVYSRFSLGLGMVNDVISCGRDDRTRHTTATGRLGA